MSTQAISRTLLLAAGLALAAQAVHAALPPLTAAQQQAAADKKAKDAAQAAKDKEELTASMDAVTAHYRATAAKQGWKTHPPVAVAAAAPAAVNQPNAGNAPAGQPDGKLTAAGASLPIHSEKFGTAPPSADVKPGPTPSVPAGAPPAVVKDTPKVKNK
jgi:colicin import membrane protein